jgi:uracil-DNA glycosylase
MSDSPSFAGPPEALAARIRACRICVTAPLGPPLPQRPRPIVVLSATARLVIASQAPGNRADRSGVPFDDASGTRLREWMAIGATRFYDPSRVMIVPMGFCFPGYDADKGDRPPRRECRAAWHDDVFAALPQVETILAVGLHAIRYHLARLHPDWPRDRSLTETVQDWRLLPRGPGQPRLIPLPHPSWRNSGWIKQNPFFTAELLPVLRAEVVRLTGAGV